MPLLSHGALYTILSTKEVDYSMLRTFGYLVYASTLSVPRTKFDPRALPCIFIGYPVGMKIYKLYDVTTKKIFISRDVFFFENIFPFQDGNMTISSH